MVAIINIKKWMIFIRFVDLTLGSFPVKELHVHDNI